MPASNYDKTLYKGTVVGSLHSVQTVVPMMRKIHSSSKVKEFTVNSADVTGSGQISGSDVDSVDVVADVDLSHLNDEQQLKMRGMLYEVKDVFAASETDIGDVKDFKMAIQLTDNIPIKEPYRRIPRHWYDEVRNTISDLVMNGWIKESNSSYSAPIVCAKKKDGKLRMCIDYRRLNNKTVADAQPIPRIQDILDGLGGKKWFSTVDMAKAYHQGYIAEHDRHFTAFSTPWTLYEWVRIP